MSALEKSKEPAQESEAPRRLVPVRLDQREVVPQQKSQGRIGRCRRGPA